MGCRLKVPPGQVTSFLGPNGSGKSTTMRVMMDLDAPGAGNVTINRRPHRDLPWPSHEFGVLSEAKTSIQVETCVAWVRVVVGIRRRCAHPRRDRHGSPRRLIPRDTASSQAQWRLPSLLSD
ncbi:MAG: ATP-binding cassette domain-containing protein [Acidimicrobiales bacterium]